MCGLAGFSGINTTQGKKEELVFSLGAGIDGRGGHAAGFVALPLAKGKPAIGKKPGMWLSARDRFIRRAALGHTTLMHARFSTCGGDPQALGNAHPFEIVRKGEIVLYGAHNGVIYNASDSAKTFGRRYTVDSKELFELLADGNYDALTKLQGYGVITWYEPKTPGVILICKLTESAEIAVAATECGGLVWASTNAILKDALKDVSLSVKTDYELDTGKVYQVKNGGIFSTLRANIKISSGFQSSLYGWDNTDGAESNWLGGMIRANHRRARRQDMSPYVSKYHKVDGKWVQREDDKQKEDEARAMIWMKAAHDSDELDDRLNGRELFESAWAKDLADNADASDAKELDTWLRNRNTNGVENSEDVSLEDDADNLQAALEDLGYEMPEDTEDLKAEIRQARKMLGIAE